MESETDLAVSGRSSLDFRLTATLRPQGHSHTNVCFFGESPIFRCRTIVDFLTYYLLILTKMKYVKNVNVNHFLKRLFKESLKFIHFRFCGLPVLPSHNNNLNKTRDDITAASGWIKSRPHLVHLISSKIYLFCYARVTLLPNMNGHIFWSKTKN